MSKIILFFAIGFSFVPFIEYDTGVRCFTSSCPSGRFGSLLQYIMGSYTGVIYHFYWLWFFLGLVTAYFLSSLISLLKIDWRNFFAFGKLKVIIFIVFSVITAILYLGDCGENCGEVAWFLSYHTENALLRPLRFVISPILVPAQIYVGGLGEPSFQNYGFVIIVILWFFFLVNFVYYLAMQNKRTVK